ncbi:hypothetical protein [Pigeonpox virus]|nr:hypothetical protein [Pigeonpox virus]
MDLAKIYRSMFIESDDDVIKKVTYYEMNYDGEEHYDRYRYKYINIDELDEEDHAYKYDMVSRYNSTIHLAAQARRFNVVKALLDYRYSTPNELESSLARSPLHLVASIPNLDYMTIYLFTSNDEDDLETIREHVLSAERMNLSKSVIIPIIREVFKGNKNLSDQDIKNLAEEVNNEELKIAKLLLDEGARIDEADIYKTTALHRAAMSGKADMVKLLIDYGACTSLKAINEITFSDYVLESDNIELCKYILDDNKDSDILCKAIEKNSVNIAKYLISLGYNVTSRDGYDNTPLHYACEIRNHELVKTILELGADVNATNLFKRNPIYESTDPKITDTMLEHGAEVNLLDKYGINILRGTEKYKKSNQVIISYIALKCFKNPEENKYKSFELNMKKINSSTLLRNFMTSCEEELQAIDNIKLNSRHSLLIFINGDFKILSKLVNNPIITRLDTSEFKIYGEKIKYNIQYSIERLNSIETSVYKIDDVLQCSDWKYLPVEVQYSIVSLLDDKDLSIISNM